MCSTSKVEECLSLISNLSAEVARLAKRVEAVEWQKYAEGYKQGRFDAEMDRIGEVISTTRLSRKEIVERAKADIDALKSGDHYIVKIQTNPPFNQASCNVEFIVNRKKRTVVALLKGLITGRVYERGIAKCAPDDCFNEDIGKAIALRRALGEEVPQEYTNAPQPEGVEVGDVVALSNIDEVVTVNFESSREALSHQVDESIAKVIDDSDREEYR